ncbi:MAG: Uma2 family endonuclease [Leptolyngbya sp.]|nr:Uma2 family endonuclease [Leptolyngbya sp.]
MAEYRDCGVRLGWLIDPTEKQVQIYRLGRLTEYLNQPEDLSREDVLPGFVLTLSEIWGWHPVLRCCLMGKPRAPVAWLADKKSAPGAVTAPLPHSGHVGGRSPDPWTDKGPGQFS